MTQIRRRLRCAVTLKVVWRRHRNEIVVHQFGGNDPFVRRKSAAYRQIHVIPPQHAEGIAQGNVQHDVRIPVLETVEQRQQHRFAKPGGGTDPQLPHGARLVLLNRLMGGFQLCQ